ncbi:MULTISPECIES: NAD-dependent epimerase/dehydratase family protein [Persicobacter]|uniref:NAD-dependent epimerase n=1 Tax=Persicobacter diffluens TaxID=981 RepID=A0AAN5AI88_9BACT|nr:NAD-dependent epimerase/dehydratase family protein [Persicobacter sp. CCB-QB2]GJM59649.1 NAD-dependent epimerase [Persicobacter diffluens]
MERVLVIGAFGQLGSELTDELRKLYGEQNVIASDLTVAKAQAERGPFEQLDVLDRERLGQIVEKHKITQIYNLAAILSSIGESKPGIAWNVNMNGLVNVLELAREKNLNKIYWPSSIAVFGPDTPKVMTPQETVMNPTTMYGVNKLAGEKLCQYYFQKFGVDVRSVRYPGLVGYKAMPGGGTTDYAVDIYFKAKQGEEFNCFLDKGTVLPMMYMEDAIRGTIQLMESPAEQVKIRTSYNLAGMSFAPEEIGESIQKIIPDFKMVYKPDHRQAIAESWPDSIDDQFARAHWNWAPKFDLDAMTKDILEHI